MGFFDKAKQFMGGKNMANVAVEWIESPLPVTDSGVKGRMVVTANEPCEVLATKYEVTLRFTRDGSEFNSFVRSDKDPDPNTSYSDDFPKFPVKMTPGESFTMPFSVFEMDIPKALAAIGFNDPNQAVSSGAVQLIVKCIADVKGSPFDPSAEIPVQLLPSA